MSFEVCLPQPSAIFEGISAVIDPGKDFLKVFQKLDQRNNIKINVGTKVSIINVRMSQDFVELFGFKTPKRITKIVLIKLIGT